MALIFAESFANITSSSDGTGRGWTLGASTTFPSEGRNGGTCLKNAGASGTARRSISNGSSLIRTAFWYKASAAPSSENFVVSFSNVALTQSGGIKVNTDGKLRAYSWGTSPALLASGAINLATSTYVYIEVEAYFADSGGSMKVWVNGVLDINFSGDSLASGTVSLDIVQYQALTASSAWIDDILLWNDAGSGLTGNLGGKAYTMTVLRPTSDVTTDFTRSTGATNYGTVDETVLNDTDYNDSATSGHVDLYGFSDTGLAGSTAVLGVVVEAVVANPGGGTIDYKLLSDIGGTTVEGTQRTAPAGETVIHELFMTKPGGGAWTATNVDAGRFGIKVA